MKKMLVGLVGDGHQGGVDKFILDLHSAVNGTVATVDLLTSDFSEIFANELKKSGTKLISCPRMTTPSALYSSVKKTVHNGNYDIVYLNLSTAVGFSAVKGAKDGGAERVIVHSHSAGYCDNNQLKELLFMAIHYIGQPVVCKNATDFLACSDIAAKWMFGNHAIKKNRVTYILNRVDDSVFCRSEEKRTYYRKKYGVESKKVIGIVGLLHKVKNQSFLLRLMPELLKQNPNYILMIVGNGSDEEKLKALAEQLGIIKSVIFTGFVNTSEGIMNCFDLLCMPSLFEGFPFVGIEAQKHGIPCLFSDTITRQVVISENCCFIPLTDYSMWINKIVDTANTEKSQLLSNTAIDSFTDVSLYTKKLIEECEKNEQSK